MLIDCSQCAMQGSHHCAECVVSAVVDGPVRGGALVFDAEEERALREMARAGLVPEVRMRPKAGTG